MYDARYGTDWTSLTHDDAVERAFALGVADLASETINLLGPPSNGSPSNGPPTLVDRVGTLDRPSFTDLPESPGEER